MRARLACLLLCLALPAAPAASGDAVPPADAAGPGHAAEDAPHDPGRGIGLPPRGARPAGAPALAMTLAGISDWSTQHPFVDVMKTARPWTGRLSDGQGIVSVEELRAGGHLSAAGWPRHLPEGVARIETHVLTDQPRAAEHLRGAYVLRHAGRGEIRVSGRARRVEAAHGEIRFHYAPGPGAVGIAIAATDPGDPIRDITLVQEAHLPLHEVGALFNPDWLGRIGDLRVVRFADWMATDGSPVGTWDDRPRMHDYTWAEWGVPLPAMIALANRIGADPWFTLPHRADDAYVRAFAEAVRHGLDPERTAYVEYSNEVWNPARPQARWAAAQAAARWGPSATGGVQFYALRAAEIMDIWTEVFGADAAARLVRVVTSHTERPGLEAYVLTAPLAFLALGGPPKERFDAYAIAGFFGQEAADPDVAARIAGWLDRSEDAAREAGEALGLRRVALREHVRARRFDAAFAPMEALIRDGSLGRLTGELLPHHAAVARAAGLDPLMYAGGNHAAVRAEDLGDAALTDFLEAFAYAPEMAALYRDAIEGWRRAGGRLFNAYVDVSPPSPWGSWGALRHLDDATPRWDVLMAANARATTGREDRGAAAFAGGVARAGSGRIEGTAGPDVLIGGPGDDVLVSGGGSDRLHGGAGRDRAILPGPRAAYRIETQDGRYVALRGRDRVTLVAVEELGFAGAAEEVVPLE